MSGKKEGGCVEACALASNPDERVSDFFLEKLRSLSSAGHHVDSAFSPSLWKRNNAFWVAPHFLSAENLLAWQQSRRWGGPCTGLVAYFSSKAVQDDDSKNVVDLHELRYRTEAEAKRVASLLEDSWDWNYHPFVAVQAGRSVIVAEGRHRAWDALARVAAHFGGKFKRDRIVQGIPLCGDPGNSKPLASLKSEDAPKNALLVHALGFSPSGRFAWLEVNTVRGATTWLLHIQNLINDRQLALETYSAGSEAAFCAQHPAAVVERLAEYGIRTGTYTSFDNDEANENSTKLTIRSASEAQVEVVLVGQAGSSVIGKIQSPAKALEALGLLRSPFEARSVAMVAEKGPAKGEVKLHVFGGRLDKVEKKESK